jgi:hypothetical protein
MTSRRSDLSDAFEIEAVRRRLEEGNGGYEIVHTSPGLEVGVYVLMAPEPIASSRTKTTSSTSCSRVVEP